MAVSSKKGVVGILTGGGDVPGLNPAIRAVTIRALREGYSVIGLRRGWASLVDTVRDAEYDNSDNYQVLTEELVNRAEGAPVGPARVRIQARSAKPACCHIFRAPIRQKRTISRRKS